MEMFWTADTHEDHANIIKYCNRPFMNELELKRFKELKTLGNENDIRKMPISWESVQRMNKTIIDNINNLVGTNDTLYHLGDFIFTREPSRAKQIRDMINCKNIFLIYGNHDRRDILRGLFSGYYDQYELRLQDVNITMNHYAMLRWNKSHHGAYHCFGHSHSTLNPWIQANLPEARLLDVGVDGHDFKPWHLDEIRKYMSTKKGEQLDHHEGG